MKKVFFILCFLFCSIILFGQESAIKWGEVQKKQGRLITILSKTEGEFYTLRWLGGTIGGRYQVTRNVGLKRIARNNIRLVVNKSIASFESAGIVHGEFVVFLSDKQAGQHQLFMQKYDLDLQPKGTPILLASYDLKPAVKGSFDVVFSSRGNYFGVTWELPGRKDRRLVYGFTIYNDELKKINDGEYPLSYDPKYVRVLRHHVSNSGAYFMAFSELKASKKVVLRNTPVFKKLHVYHIDTSGLRDLVIDVAGRRIEAMAMSTTTQDEFVVTGVYGLDNVLGVSGIFHKKLRLSDGELIVESYKDFAPEFITDGWSKMALRRVEKKKLKGEGPALQHYQMREVTMLEDGGIIGTMEQYYVQVQSYTSTNMNQSSDRRYYHFNDIIAFKILPDGVFYWITKIQKYQVSVNDGGPYSSYASYPSDSTLNFIFNDNRMNYNDDGSFKSDLKLYTANYGRKKNVVALTRIDLKTGEIERKAFFDRHQIEAIAVPKRFNVNPFTKEMILYSIWGRNERIGVLKF
ncbi:MAG: hypothetical protein P8H33_01295 [Crocinitomicaceae bacterium]|nr:hypothetical protein [Crocinitomicaceae bacterium]